MSGAARYSVLLPEVSHSRSMLVVPERRRTSSLVQGMTAWRALV